MLFRVPPSQFRVLNMNWRSMRARATMGFVAAFALLLLVTGTGLLAFAYYEERARVRTRLSANASSLADELNDESRSGISVQKIVADDEKELHLQKLVSLVYDERNRLLACSSRQVPSLDSSWITYSHQSGKWHIVVATKWDGAAHELSRLAWSLLAGALVVLIAAAIGAWALVGRVLSPVERLAEAARTAPVENARLEAPSEDIEIKRLVGTLNGFLERLRASNRAKDRFYAAASHELRTPLQGLAGFLEIGLARPRERDELVEILREAQGQSQRLVKLTQDLLSLNQLEHSPASSALEREPIDVADVVERALLPLEPTRRARHLTLELDLPSGAEAEIVAPWSHVEMLVRNLVENAHKYAPDCGLIRIQWQDQTLRVWNTVAWKPSEKLHTERKLHRLFEPFFRLDASREGQVTGNGLGLAICHAICQSNGWPITLQATPEPQAGLEARIEFADSQTPLSRSEAEARALPLEGSRP